MTLWQGRSKRKTTGGRRIYSRKKRKFEISPEFKKPIISEPERKTIRGRGGNQKVRVVGEKYANLADKDGEVEKVEIKDVLRNPANPNYVQRNILTKGTIIETEKGEAKITSRPGQDGVVNAQLVD